MKRSAFTFVELCLGLVVVAMVMSALAAFALAVSKAWQYSDESESSAMTGTQAAARVIKRLHDAKRIGYWHDSPPVLVYWQADGDGDDRMQFSELAMMRWDAESQTLEYRQAAAAPAGSDPGGTGDVVSWTEFTAEAIAARIIDSSSAVPLVHNVTASSLDVQHANDASMSPTVQMSLTVPSLTPARPAVTQLVTATLRGPAPAQ